MNLYIPTGISTRSDDRKGSFALLALGDTVFKNGHSSQSDTRLSSRLHNIPVEIPFQERRRSKSSSPPKSTAPPLKSRSIALKSSVKSTPSSSFKVVKRARIDDSNAKFNSKGINSNNSKRTAGREKSTNRSGSSSDEVGSDDDDDDDDVEPFSPPVQDLEQGYEADDVPSAAMQRSPSHPTNENCGPSRSDIPNQLAATFLIASGRMHQRFNGLCALAGTDLILVNGMTTMDCPHNEANREKQLKAQSLVISDIFLHFGKFDAEHRDPVVMVFQELRDISVAAWRIMSMYAFSNLFRLTEGTDFAIYYKPEDAIFTQGRDYCLPRQEAAVMRFPMTRETMTESETVVVAQKKDAEEEVPSYD